MFLYGTFKSGRKRGMFFSNIRNGIKLVYRLLKVFGKDKNPSDEDVDTLVSHANQIGPMALKLIQFLIIHDAFATKHVRERLSCVFEDCHIHDWVHTEKMYKEDFGHDIHTDFVVLQTDVKSGSIGQVYKMYHKKMKRFVAVKVKHPHIDEQARSFIRIITAVVKVCYVFSRMPYLYLITEFVQNIKFQLDYVREANNTILFNARFKDIECVVTPEVHYYSERCIVMSYHEGKPVAELTDHQELVVSCYMTLFILHSLLIKDLLHCDLHGGNWKAVIDDNNKVQLIIYDCGLIASMNDPNIPRTICKSIFSSIANLLDILGKGSSFEVNRLRHIIQAIESQASLKTSDRFRRIVMEFLKSSMRPSTNIIRSLQGVIVGCDSMVKSVNHINSIIRTTNVDTEITIFCYKCVTKAVPAFHELHTYFDAWLESIPEADGIVREWLLKTNGHDDKDVYQETLCELLGLC